MRSIFFALLMSTSLSCTFSKRVQCNPGGHECDSFPGAFCGSDNFCQLTSGVDGSIDLGDAGPSCVAANCTNVQQPVCGSAGECVACTSVSDGDAQCAMHPGLHFCGAAGTCVECRTSSDCATSANGPVCDNTKCRKCIATSECASSVCILSGANAGLCADPSMVAWVDNTGACAAGDGSNPGSAACAIDKALLLDRPYVHVAGSATPYSAIATLVAATGNVGPVQISGPGIKAAQPARVFTQGTDEIAITANGSNTATVTLEGLEIGGTPGGAKGLYGVNVSTMNSGMVNVTITGCFIHDNGSGGITLNGNTTYTIVNSIIAANGIGTNAGVFLANSTSGTFAFNTVANNSSSSTYGGIDCNSASKSIVDSIVVGNSGTQLGVTCMAPEGYSATTTSNITFVSTTDWHLVAGDAKNVACCFDKVPTDPMTAFKNVDVDGTKRPKNSAWDYGAHEAQ